ncbi:septum formation inhibitor Maf [Mycobacterium sp. MS1601]|uniref:Maf family protein n=1 Tax=Mycobacterium sp. MS1601 TaxID=1936029 RepID=UPI0009794EE6|nr:Maf family protein [Mycobacterium sp. MS1601]AQA01471.1 septum formation inhibitor Maf [Mycobacterium sp. MS1601]
MTRLVLASASSGRLKVLNQAGVQPHVRVSGVDEDAIIAAMPGAPHAEVVTALAVAKAHDVAAGLPADISADCVVIGCDSMLLLDGQLRGKPGTPEAAHAQWGQMAGRSGELFTGHCVVRMAAGSHREIAESGCTTVHFGKPTAADLTAYIAGGEPLFVAGAFTLDGLGAWFVDRIEGDPSNVIGLSLPLLRRMLADLGVSVASLWAANPA